ncbi:MAG: TonB-dependent receptor [Bacteroidota bacterium]
MEPNPIKKWIVAILILLPFLSVAQTGDILGKITDQDSNPIPYANVLIENTNIGTLTDDKGEFVLRDVTYGDYTIIVSFLGFKSQELAVSHNGQNNALREVVLEESAFALDDVTIVTNRDEESIDEIPASVSVLTSRDIEVFRQHANTMADIVAYVPGVSLSTNTTQTRGQNIRGRNMLVLIDGIPQSTPLFITNRDLNTIDPEVIERVEVIKGATSIYGNGAEGGIINFITKNGSTNKKLESQTTLGASGSLVNTDHTIGTNISQIFKGRAGNLNYIVGGSFRETGIMRSAANEISSPFYGLGETEFYNVFTKIGYNLNDKNRLELMYNYFSSNQNSNLNRIAGVYGEIPTTGAFGETNSLEEDQGTRFNHNYYLKFSSYDLFANTDLELNLYGQNFQTVYGFSAFFTDIDGGFEGGQSRITSDKRGARLNLTTRYTLADVISGKLIYGVDYMGDITEQTLTDGRVYTPAMDMNNIAPYLQVKAQYQDLIFKGGVRYENINIDIDDYTTLVRNSDGTASGGVNVIGDELNYSALTFNTGIRYNAWRYAQPFFSFSQSFSVGQLGRILRNATDPEAINGRIDTEAVIANNYEFGITSDITDKIKFQGTYFLSTSDLGTTFSEQPSGLLALARLPERVYGIELQLDTRLTDKLDFGVSLATIEGRTDDNDDGNFDDDDSYINGTRINPSVFRAYLGYEITPVWNFRLFSTFSGDRDRFDPRADGSFAYGNGPVNSFTVTSLFTSYQLAPNTKLLLGIENLFNEDYYTVRSQWAGRDTQYEKGNGINFNLRLSIQL